jgi:uncharacterized protein (TIRG00374 family)
MAVFWKKKQFWGALIGIALLAYCVKDIRLSELHSLAERVNYYYLIPAVLCGFLFMSFKGMRWRLMIIRQKRVPRLRAITVYCAAQILGIVMPALTGQVGRIILLAHKEALRKTFVFSAIVLEILFDAISLIVFMLVTSLAFAFPANYRFMSFVVAAVTVGMMILLYVILHYQAGVEEFGRRRMRERWPGAYITFKKFLRSFTKGIEVLRSSQHTIGTLAYSLAAWTTHMMVVWFLMKSFGLDLPFATAAVVMIINTIVLMVPITPGNAGTFELAVSTSLAAFSVGRSDAVLFALALHILDLVPTLILGFYFLHLEKLSLRRLKQENQDEDILDRIDEEGAFIEEGRK